MTDPTNPTPGQTPDPLRIELDRNAKDLDVETVEFQIVLAKRTPEGARVAALDADGEPLTDASGAPVWATEDSPILVAYKPTPYTVVRAMQVAGSAAKRVNAGVDPKQVLNATELAQIEAMLSSWLNTGLLPQSKAWIEGQLMDPRSGLTPLTLLKPFVGIVAFSAKGPSRP